MPTKIDSSNVDTGTIATLTGAQVVSNKSLKTTKETITVTAAAPAATTNFDVVTQSVQYYTTNAANNFTLNLRGGSTTTLNSLMSIGEVMTIALLVTNGATAYYPTAFQVDGSSVTPKVQGGTAISAGNANSVDVYSVMVVKTANATFSAFVSQTKFA
jgi:hypothetical protein